MQVKYIVGALVALVLAFCAGAFLGPRKTEIREVEHVVYRDRVVTDLTHDTSSRTKETVMPDGTKVKETIVEDRRRSRTEAEREAERTRILEKKTESRPSWRLGAVYKPPVLGLTREGYGVIIERRIVGEIYLGAAAFNDRTLGITLSVGF